jgi:hypothetical protein
MWSGGLERLKTQVHVKAGLLSGDFDVIDEVSTGDLKEVNANANTTAAVNSRLLARLLQLNTQGGPTADPNFASSWPIVSIEKRFLIRSRIA